MKKLFVILIFVALFGMLSGSVNANDLQEYDFNGHFTLDVPGNYWMGVGSGGHTYENDKGVRISHFSIEDVKKEGSDNFDDYVKSLGLKDGKADGNFIVFKDGEKYVVMTKSDDEIYLIYDRDLDEAKAIAGSAKLSSSDTNTTNESTPAKPSVELESHDFNGTFKMDVPKTASLAETNSTDAAFNGAIVYANASGDLNITYVENGEINDKSVDKFASDFAKQNHGELSTNGNLNLITVGPYNEVIFNDGNKMIMIVASQLDLDTITAMAQSFEFTK